jgi:hypothetical protein
MHFFYTNLSACSVRTASRLHRGCGRGGRGGRGRAAGGVAMRGAAARGQMGPWPCCPLTRLAARALCHRHPGGGAGQPPLLQDRPLYCGRRSRFVSRGQNPVSYPVSGKP